VTEYRTTTEKMDEIEVYYFTVHHYNGTRTAKETHVTPQPRKTTSPKTRTSTLHHHTTTTTRHQTTTALSTSTHLIVSRPIQTVTEYKDTTTTKVATETLNIIVHDYGTKTVNKVEFTLVNEADVAIAIAELATISYPAPIATEVAVGQTKHENPSREMMERHCKDMCQEYQPCLRNCLGHWSH
jgi:hypothetical protein